MSRRKKKKGKEKGGAPAAAAAAAAATTTAAADRALDVRAEGKEGGEGGEGGEGAAPDLAAEEEEEEEEDEEPWWAKAGAIEPQHVRSIVFSGPDEDTAEVNAICIPINPDVVNGEEEVPLNELPPLQPDTARQVINFITARQRAVERVLREILAVVKDKPDQLTYVDNLLTERCADDWAAVKPDVLRAPGAG